MRRLLAAAAMALALVLGGCSSADEYSEETAQSLQEAVLAVSQPASAGDWAGATLALDDVAARVAAALAAGDISEDRAHEISMAIELVRTDLQNLIAAQQEQLEQQQQDQQEDGDDDGDEGNGNGPPDKEDKEDKDKGGKKD